MNISSQTEVIIQSQTYFHTDRNQQDSHSMLQTIYGHAFVLYEVFHTCPCHLSSFPLHHASLALQQRRPWISSQKLLALFCLRAFCPEHSPLHPQFLQEGFPDHCLDQASCLYFIVSQFPMFCFPCLFPSQYLPYL